MKLLHTSDWHLGRSLYGRKRYEEFEQFLDWLTQTIEQEQVDVLLIAGDVFDTTTPSNRAQSLYYECLCRIAASNCRHVVVIAGNHDSPSFLNAPKALLRSLDVHVIGAKAENIADEVLVLTDSNDQAEIIVCAVPYLRDRDIRLAEAGESIEDKERKLTEGIRSHYAEVCALAEQQRETLGADIPIVGMGHLFAAGGQTIDGDGVRELYVGSLAHVTAAIFPASIDYLALGHLHVPQKIGGLAHMRYSGSPIAMGFGEAKQTKSVCLVSFKGKQPTVKLHSVPVFQTLQRIQGDKSAIEKQLQALSASDTPTWLEIIYDGQAIIGDLRQQLEAIVDEGENVVEILRVKNNRIIERALSQPQDLVTLDELNVSDVFQRCLDAHNISDEQRPELLLSFEEIITSLNEHDSRAE